MTMSQFSVNKYIAWLQLSKCSYVISNVLEVSSLWTAKNMSNRNCQNLSIKTWTRALRLKLSIETLTRADLKLINWCHRVNFNTFRMCKSSVTFSLHDTQTYLRTECQKMLTAAEKDTSISVTAIIPLSVSLLSLKINSSFSLYFSPLRLMGLTLTATRTLSLAIATK